MNFDVIATDLGFTEGPVWAPDGTVWFVSIPHQSIYRMSADGRILERVHTKGGPNGLAVDSQGAIYIAQNGGAYGGTADTEAGIQIYKDGKLDYLLQGGGPDAPNDLCFGPDGRLYFTDPRGDEDPNPEDATTSRPGRLYSCKRDGTDLTMHWEGPVLMNGLAFDVADQSLYVLQTMTPQGVWKLAYDQDGGLSDPRRFADIDGWPDGMAVDSEGRLWVGNVKKDCIDIVAPGGELVTRIQLPEGTGPANICFGGDDLRSVFVTGSSAGTMLKGFSEVPGLALHA